MVKSLICPVMSCNKLKDKSPPVAVKLPVIPKVEPLILIDAPSLNAR